LGSAAPVAFEETYPLTLLVSARRGALAHQ